MTRQYLVGELSVLLADLQASAASPSSSRAAARLRHEVERVSLDELTSVAERALELTDRGCWESLARGDASDFARHAATAAELWQFAVCADLVDDP